MRIARKARLPGRVTDHDHRTWRRNAVVFWRKRAAQHGMHAQHIEIISAGLESPNMRILAAVTDSDGLNPIRDESGKSAVPFPEIDVIGIRLRDETAARVQVDQFARAFHR